MATMPKASRPYRLSAQTHRALQALAMTLALTAGLAGSRTALADTTASHKVVVRVEPISTLTLGGGDIALALATPPPGGTSSVTDTSCNLNWMTNQSSQKITVGTSLANPSLRLTVEAVAVDGGRSLGTVQLAGGAQDLISGLTPGLGKCDLKYTAETTGLQPTSPDVHLITYTLTDVR